MTDELARFRAYLRHGVTAPELRAAGESSGSTGGYAVPQDFRAKVAVELARYAVLARDFERVETANGRTMPFPTRQPATAGSVPGENPAAALSDVDAVYGQGSLSAWAVSSGVHRVSMQLDADSAVPIEDALAAYAGESIGRKLSALSVSGTGTSQPTGILAMANTQGAWSAGKSGGYVTLSAAQKIQNFADTSGSSATELNQNTLSPATLLNMIKAVDPAYFEGSKWYLNTTQFLGLCAQTDTSGQPLIRPNGPLTLWDFPVVIAPDVPDLAASTTGGPVFGNLKAGVFWRDAGMELKRLDQRYADLAQVGFIGYGRHDFKARDARAFVTVQAAAT